LGLRKEIDQVVVREEIKAVRQYPFILEGPRDHLKHRIHWFEVLALTQARAEAEHRQILMGLIRRLFDLVVNRLSSNYSSNRW
jgi:hypothetical protein